MERVVGPADSTARGPLRLRVQRIDSDSESVTPCPAATATVVLETSESTCALGSHYWPRTGCNWFLRAPCVISEFHGTVVGISLRRRSIAHPRRSSFRWSACWIPARLGAAPSPPLPHPWLPRLLEPTGFGLRCETFTRACINILPSQPFRKLSQAITESRKQ